MSHSGVNKSASVCDDDVCLLFLCSGKWLGSRQIRCNWATKGANAGEEKQSTDSKGMVELISGSSGEYICPCFLGACFSVRFYDMERSASNKLNYHLSLLWEV